MPFITDFDVTYGNALAPAGFHRVTTREGGSANLNAVGSTSQSFLWTHESANRGRPVVEVQVTYDSEPGPPGFERVSRDLAKGGQSGRRAYLWLRRQSTSVAENPSAASRESHGGSLSSSSSSGRTQTSGDGAITSSSRDYVDDQISHTKATPPGPSRGDEDVSAPLVDVVVVFGQESDPNVAEAAEAAEQATTASTPVDKGRKAASRGPQRVWEKLHRSLNPGAMAGDAGDVYLWYRRGSDEDSPHCPSRSFSLGDWVDARDNAGIWRVAQVVSIGAETLRVHFPSKVEEDFAFESPELAKLGTYTPGRDTGQTNRRAGEPWDIAPEQVRDMTRTLKTLCSTILEEESAPKVGGAAVGSGGWRQGRERRFWEVELPAFIERCLSSSITDEEALPPIHELFLLMLEVIAVRMWQPASMPRHLLQTLKRLGQDDRRCTWYYSTYGRPNSLLSYEAVSFNAGVGSTSLVERRAEWDRAFAQMPRGSIRAGFHSDASRLYVANLNHFGRAGGFDALLSRMDLNKAEGLASLEEVATYVGVLAQGSRFFVPAWTEGYFERVRRLVFGRLERLSNDELGGDDETVALVVKHMEVVLPTVLRDFNAAETVERFHLSFALQLLRCPLLNPRIRGVTLLSDIIDNTVRSSARRKSKSKGNTGMGTNVGYAYEWLDEEFLARWLHDENVVEAVLGDPNPSGTTSSSGGDPSKDNADEASKKVHDTHVEVLKRADGLLGFMAHHDLLEAEHLDRLWDAGRGQPDAQVRAVFRLVEHICPRLGPAGLSVLYRHLRDLPRNYEEMHVELIRQFAESASRWGARGVSASPEREVSSGSSSQSIFGQGLELLWASIRDEAPVTAEVADQASEALADLLCHPFGPGRGYGYNNTAPAGSRLQSGMGYLGGGGGAGNAAAAAAASEAELHAHRLMFFLDMCLENVEKGLSVAPSLRLMQRIIDAQPVSSAALGKPSGRRNASGGAAGISGEGVAGMRKDEILVTLDEHKGLLRRLVEELLRYRRKARPAAQEAGLLSNPDDRAAGDTGAGGAAGDPLAAKLLGARLSHGEALGIRLDFIRFAVSHSPLELTFGLVETLWRDFLADPLCDSETEVFFAWMQSATPLPRPPQGGPAFVTMSSQVVHEVFRRLLCQEGGIPFDTMGPKGFWCLWRYFTVVNSEALAGSFAQKHHVMVEDFSSIQGLDTLWEAFLRSKNPAVVADAGDLLVQLHLRLAVQADEPRVWDSFIDRCMLTFESALHQVDQRTASHDVLASERVLRLLIKFLDEIDRPRGGGSYNSTSSNSSDGLILKVVVRGVRNSNGAQTIREFNWALLKRSVTVGELRARISREMGHPANQVRVINSQRQLCPSPDFDSLLLEMAPIFSYCDAVLLERPEDDTRGYVASVRRPETVVAS